MQAARLLAFFTAQSSSDAERAANLAQHEGFLDPSTVVRNKDGSAGEDAGKVTKKPSKSRQPKERRPGRAEKRKVCFTCVSYLLSVRCTGPKNKNAG